jgi:CsoR family transcriptional regulator, copper-sensing transcriptional repressor
MAGTDVKEMAARSRKPGRAVPAPIDLSGDPPATTDASDFPRSYTKDRATLVRRLSRLEGQVRGVARMIERDEHCIDILQQTAALRAAVDSIGLLVLEDHVAGCLRTAVETGDAAASTDEVMDVVRRSLGRPVRSARSASD